MKSGGTSLAIYRFGVFEVDVTQNVLMRAGVRVRIQEQPFRALTILLEHAGEAVTRDTLRRQLWPEGTYVDFDGSLNVILKKLRAVLRSLGIDAGRIRGCATSSLEGQEVPRRRCLARSG